ncbi:hypothetical protein [Paenibacillus ginsengihumi]|uniref:hypothetical protein n=1 Tax=Paenibacillus ginsengihumi TaxID=431596 RepID=UPI00037BDDBA|nr:hypothetical protein [Paenibacillus ginsengihumi]
MTEVNQHQMPLRHVIDNAEKAIQIARDAEMAVRHAQLESNPREFAGAAAQLETARRELEKAQSQMEANDDEHHHQEMAQVQDQLTQAMQSLEAVSANMEQPRQMR